MNWTTLFKKFTNGKYIIGLLTIALLSIGSYSYAYVESQEYTINCANNKCDILQINKGDYYGVIIKSYSCPQLNIYGGTNRQDVYGAYSQGELVNFNDNISSYSTLNFTSTCFTVGDVKFVLVSPDEPIINGGTSNFAPIMTQLGNIASEFIPYMLYIAIGCASVWLAYEAVRMILRYLNKKGNIFNERVYYDRKRHNEDERNGRLKPEREYYKKR